MEKCGKRIIIFGINNRIRFKVEYGIDEDCIVVGYADWGRDFTNCRWFAYKPLFSMKELKERDDEYDYIILCEGNYDKWLKKKEKLIQLGCKEEKILSTVPISHMYERLFTSTLDDFISMKKNFCGLLFGMSYSRSAFMEHFFVDDWFKFSMNGSDLHTHDSYLTYLLINCPEQMKSVKRIMLDLPYYSFDWDIQSSNQIYSRMVQFDRLSDYETFLATKKDAGEYIRKYRILKELIGRRMEQAEGNYANYIPDNRKLDGETHNASEDSLADKIWWTEHVSTAQKNMERLAHICDLCEMHNIELIICVYPMSPIFVEKNREIYENKQKRFYDILKEVGCEDKVIDLGENGIDFSNGDFRDLTHLNIYGAIKCSKELNRILEERKQNTTDPLQDS